MQFPNEIQVALMFDRRVDCLETIVREFVRIEAMKSGVPLNVPEAKPGVFYRLFGAGELMVTFEYLDGPANMEVFRAALSSSITGILCPDIRERLMRNRSHMLITVSHGVLGNSPQLHRLMAQIGRKPEGSSLPQFLRRLDVAALASRIALDHVPAQAVHWTQSDQIVPGEAFDDFAAAAPPSPLHIHPFLFGNAQKGEIGIRTFGARHFIGREVRIEPSTLPWAANYQTILAFLGLSIMDGGYIIPDGDTFGPESGALSYRVTHVDAEEGDVPFYVLTPLMYREYGFVADDYVPRDRVINDRAPPAALMPEDDEAKMELVNEWREKRALAEGAGGQFEVRARGEGPLPPAPPPMPTPILPRVGGARPVFGRKGL